jgi:hypothetical protein
MPYSYWLVEHPEGGVSLSSHLSNFRFSTVLLNLDNGPLLCQLVFAHCFSFSSFWPFRLILLKLSVSLVCNMLMTGFHACLNLNPSWLMLFAWSHISVVSLISRSIYLTVLAHASVSLNVILLPHSVLWSATTDLSSWYRRRCLVCSLDLVSIDRPVYRTYIFPHSWTD